MNYSIPGLLVLKKIFADFFSKYSTPFVVPTNYGDHNLNKLRTKLPSNASTNVITLLSFGFNVEDV